MDVVQKLWGFCHQLRHEGIDYGDYIEQITYLLFLKMASERGLELPKDTNWETLHSKSGVELVDHYSDALRSLGREKGVLGDIYSGARSAFTNPTTLKRLLSEINETRWTELGVDVKAEAFEGLLEKAASEGKKGAGQYFTPRVLIQSIVRCVKPDPREARDFRIADPACGTGGFLMSAYEWFIDQTDDGAIDRNLATRVKSSTYFGKDLVPRPRRLALMNLYLHDLEPQIEVGDSIYEEPSSTRFDVVLTNPPFGTRGANQVPARDDFTISTANKQLNFIQHVVTVLKDGGRAAIVVPDNCLFADQAGEVFQLLMEDCDLHTVQRLPNGTFSPYSPGTKTNVIFMTKGLRSEGLWMYDGRTNVPSVTKKERPLTAAHFEEFEQCYGDNPYGRSARSEDASQEGRWRRFDIAEVRDVDFKIDSLRWLQEDSLESDLIAADPEVLIADVVGHLEAALQGLSDIVEEVAQAQ